MLLFLAGAVAFVIIVLVIVWLATCVQRYVEHDELVEDCGERLEASEPKKGEPSPIPVGTVATYGPGLAPLEYARLTGLMGRYAPTGTGAAAGAAVAAAAAAAAAAQDNAAVGLDGAVSDVPAPLQGSGRNAPPPSPGDSADIEATPVPRTASQPATPTARGSAAVEAVPPGVATPSQVASVVYPRHLPELKVQKLPNMRAIGPLAGAASRAYADAEGP